MDEETAKELIFQEAVFWEGILESRVLLLRTAQKRFQVESRDWSLLEALSSLGEQCLDAFRGLCACARKRLGRPCWILARTTYLANLQITYILSRSTDNARAARDYLKEGHDYRRYAQRASLEAMAEPARADSLRELGIDAENVAAQVEEERTKLARHKKPQPKPAKEIATLLHQRTDGEQDLLSLQYEYQFTFMSGAAHAYHNGLDLSRSDVLEPLFWTLILQVGPVCGALSASSDGLYEHTEEMYKSSKKRLLEIRGLWLADRVEVSN